jgi:hypothetical protein
MKVENQVCTLKQGQKLEELGIDAKPLFCYCRVLTSIEDSYDDLLPTEWNLEGLPDLATTWKAPAFTVSELAKMIGKGTKSAEHLWNRMLSHINSGNSCVSFYNAEFLADFVIDVLQAKYLSVEDCNKRLLE